MSEREDCPDDRFAIPGRTCMRPVQIKKAGCCFASTRPFYFPGFFVQQETGVRRLLVLPLAGLADFHGGNSNQKGWLLLRFNPAFFLSPALVKASFQRYGYKKRPICLRQTSLFDLVGVRRLELPTPCTPCKCASQLRHTPIFKNPTDKIRGMQN